MAQVTRSTIVKEAPEKKAEEEQEDEDLWKNIDKAENVTIQFFELPDAYLQYSMEIIWPEGKGERFAGVGTSASSTKEPWKGFLPKMQRAAKEAKNCKTLVVQYHNPSDRMWPYPKLPVIFEAFTIKGHHAHVQGVEVTKAGVEFTVSYSKRINFGALTSNLDLKGLDQDVRYNCYYYAGEAMLFK